MSEQVDFNKLKEYVPIITYAKEKRLGVNKKLVGTVKDDRVFYRIYQDGFVYMDNIVSLKAAVLFYNSI